MTLTPAQDRTKSAIAAAKAVSASLHLSLKTLTLYAEDHVNCKKSVARLHGDLVNFLTKLGTLVLEVRSDCLLYEGEVVHEGTSKDGDLCFALFRDGILEMVFLKGIEAEETNFLVRIIDRYKSLTTTAEGDIVTALWEARLPHLYYVATDNITEMEQDKQASTPESIDFQMPQLPDQASNTQTLHTDQLSAEGCVPDEAKQVEFKPITPTALQLTSEEVDKLEEMVRSEEERDATQEIMAMMADILKDQQDEEFFAYIIEYMLEEFTASLKRRDFYIAFRIMQTLHQVRKISEESRAWALARIHGFFSAIGRPEFMESLREILPNLTADQIKGARRVLGLLWPDAIPSLGPLLVDASGPVGEMLSEVLVSLASRDFRPMEKLVSRAQEPLVFRLTPVLARIDGKKSVQMLLKLAHYPSGRVRLEALRAIIQRKLWSPEKIGFLLEDESAVIRRIAIKYLGARKSETAEELLAKHIRSGKFDGRDSAELIACFKALGKSGTERSLPLLKDFLLKGGWISRFRPSTLRQGAAIALAELGTEQSLQVLEEASRSHYPAVRSAAQAVYQSEGEKP